MNATTISWEIGEDEPGDCLRNNKPRVPLAPTGVDDGRMRSAYEQHLTLIGALLITIICVALMSNAKIDRNAQTQEIRPFPEAVAIESDGLTVWCVSDDAEIVNRAVALASLQHDHIRQILGVDERQQERHFVLALDRDDSPQIGGHPAALIIPPSTSIRSSERIDYTAQAIMAVLVDDLLEELMGPAAKDEDWSAARTTITSWLLQNGYPQLSPDHSVARVSQSDFAPATVSIDKRPAAQLKTPDVTREIEKSISQLVALYGFPIVAELLRGTGEHKDWESLVSAVVSEQTR